MPSRLSGHLGTLAGELVYRQIALIPGTLPRHSNWSLTYTFAIAETEESEPRIELQMVSTYLRHELSFGFPILVRGGGKCPVIRWFSNLMPSWLS